MPSKVTALVVIATMGAATLFASTYGFKIDCDGSRTVAIGTYNIYVDFEGSGWAMRREQVHEYLRQQDLDILALQEVSEVQMADFAAEHPKFDYVVGERSDGHRNDQAWYEFVPVLYDRERYEPIDEQSFWVSETPTRPGSIMPDTKNHGRVFTWVRLRDRESGEKILVGNVHIHGLQARMEMDRIVDMLRKVEHDGPVVLLGDYNFEPESETYVEFSGGGRYGDFRDARNLAHSVSGPDNTTIGGSQYTYNSDGSQQHSPEFMRIDYIFVCGIDEVSRFSTDQNPLVDGEVYASDHFALTAQINGVGRCSLKPPS